MIVCQIEGARVILEDGRWRGRDRILVDILQGLADARRRAQGGAIADPERDIVNDALLRVGGRIVSLQGHEPPEAVEGRIY